MYFTEQRISVHMQRVMGDFRPLVDDRPALVPTSIFLAGLLSCGPSSISQSSLLGKFQNEARR